MSFHTLALHSSLLEAIQEEGFSKPTPIQTKVIPLVLQKQDLLVQAHTGTGKSASFILPILHMLRLQKDKDDYKKARIRILVLAPTRELVLQLSKAFDTFSKHLRPSVKTVCFIGGENIGDQLYDVQQGCDIIVTSPGRLLDILSKKQMNLSYLEHLVVDEADKMLHFGFSEELDAILEAIPAKRQNLLFSATYPQKVLDLSARITAHASHIHLDTKNTIVETLEQRVVQVNKENRAPLLRHLLQKQKLGQTLVFMANKRATDNIAMKFKKHDFNAQSFHGDLDQEERNATLKEFKEKKIHILFTTDLVSRGIHIDDVHCVINYDLPRSASDYIHRIGRAGRAGKSGLAISFIDFESEAHFALIEKRSAISLQREQIEGFALQGQVPEKIKGSAPVKGKKKSKKDKLREKALQEQKKP